MGYGRKPINSLGAFVTGYVIKGQNIPISGQIPKKSRPVLLPACSNENANSQNQNLFTLSNKLIPYRVFGLPMV
ncbi:hypothetical protein A0256_09025 [Mucilaginibacter sp. PAMC 26640]|nr:hypothetical protein A0256_09025 [Mucilaginibacter sp. PAMC 26640]